MMNCGEILTIIGESAKRGGEMVKQVLSFARGVEGQRMDVQVRHLIEDIEKITTDTFLKNIDIRTTIPPELWPVSGDPTQLHQVLMNLCVNARDAMPNGGLLNISGCNVTLDAHYAALNIEAHPGPYVFIQIEDNGIGIPAPVIKQIFDPFFTTKPVGKRNRARPFHLTGHHQKPRRLHPGLLGERKGHQIQDLPSRQDGALH